MNMLFMVPALLPLVMAADPDPTKFCSPKQFSYTSSFVVQKTFYNVYNDFDKNMVAWVDPQGKTRTVFDANTKTEYDIDTKPGGKCTSFKTELPANVQCLPAEAEYIGLYREGFISPDTLNLHGFVFNHTGTRYAFVMNEDLGQGSYALIAAEYAPGKQANIVFNSDPKVGIADPHVFDIPSPCPLTK